MTGNLWRHLHVPVKVHVCYSHIPPGWHQSSSTANPTTSPAFLGFLDSQHFPTGHRAFAAVQKFRMLGRRSREPHLPCFPAQLCQSLSWYSHCCLTLVCFTVIVPKLQGSSFPHFHLHDHFLTLQVAHSFPAKHDGKWISRVENPIRT